MTTMLSNTKSRDKEKEDTQCMKIKRGKSKRKNEENACKKTIAAKWGGKSEKWESKWKKIWSQRKLSFLVVVVVVAAASLFEKKK